MLDLRVSINVIPYFIYSLLNIGPLKDIGVIIQLIDRSNAYPNGVLENVLVQVNDTLFHANFYVLDIQDETNNIATLFYWVNHS